MLVLDRQALRRAHAAQDLPALALARQLHPPDREHLSALGPKSLSIAKFIPGFASLAATLAGVSRTRTSLFLFYDAVGAALWAGVALLLGYLFRDAVSDILITLYRLGRIGLALIAAALAVFVLKKWWQRRLLLRRLHMDRISVPQLRAPIDKGAAPLILDVRSAADHGTGRIPGALPVTLADPHAAVAGVDKDREVVIYCACPNEVSAAKVAKMLMAMGFSRVRPLLGGTDAWREAGFALA